jgi:DNA-binding Lrp family transcriptional regulator
VEAYVLIKIRPSEVPDAVRQFRSTKGVVEATATFGSYDAIARLEASDLNAIGRIVTWDIQTVPGVTDTLTCLAIEVN